MTDMRSDPRRPTRGNARVVCSIEKVPFAHGYMQVMTLQCGHKVEHLQRNDLKVGSRTRCPECR